MSLCPITSCHRSPCTRAASRTPTISCPIELVLPVSFSCACLNIAALFPPKRSNSRCRACKMGKRVPCRAASVIKQPLGQDAERRTLACIDVADNRYPHIWNLVDRPFPGFTTCRVVTVSSSSSSSISAKRRRRQRQSSRRTYEIVVIDYMDGMVLCTHPVQGDRWSRAVKVLRRAPHPHETLSTGPHLLPQGCKLGIVLTAAAGSGGHRLGVCGGSRSRSLGLLETEGGKVG